MKLIEITQAETWDAFVSAQAYAQFTQSWAWGEFRHKTGCEVRRFAVLDEIGDWRGAVQLEWRRRHFGLGYWFAPRGPIFLSKASHAERKSILDFLLDVLQEKKEFREHVVFWRMEPMVRTEEKPSKATYPRLVWHPSLNPANSAVLDVAKTDSELLAHMHSKTRYNIRVAEKHGVTIREASGEKDIETFLDLYQETGKRDGFVPQPRAYVKKTMEAMHGHRMATVRIAEWKGQVLSANLEIAYGDTVMYLYGSSSAAHREVMAPYALHWAAIQSARQKGFHYYDFGGANPASTESPEYKGSWEGITRFKKNWGAQVWEFMGTWDMPQRPWVYRLLRLRG